MKDNRLHIITSDGDEFFTTVHYGLQEISEVRAGELNKVYNSFSILDHLFYEQYHIKYLKITVEDPLSVEDINKPSLALSLNCPPDLERVANRTMIINTLVIDPRIFSLTVRDPLLTVKNLVIPYNSELNKMDLINNHGVPLNFSYIPDTLESVQIDNNTEIEDNKFEELVKKGVNIQAVDLEQEGGRSRGFNVTSSEDLKNVLRTTQLQRIQEEAENQMMQGDPSNKGGGIRDLMDNNEGE